jgi:hypothetical protein
VQVRAPDYDDWTLNGDIMVRHPKTGYRHELSSMGIRVDAAALEKQLAHRNMSERLQLAYHKAIMDHTLPLCMGGGIGISRLLMLLLQRGHIGEVQVCCLSVQGTLDSNATCNRNRFDLLSRTIINPTQISRGMKGMHEKILPFFLLSMVPVLRAHSLTQPSSTHQNS